MATRVVLKTYKRPYRTVTDTAKTAVIVYPHYNIFHNLVFSTVLYTGNNFQKNTLRNIVAVSIVVCKCLKYIGRLDCYWMASFFKHHHTSSEILLMGWKSPSLPNIKYIKAETKWWLTSITGLLNLESPKRPSGQFPLWWPNIWQILAYSFSTAKTPTMG